MALRSIMYLLCALIVVNTLTAAQNPSRVASPTQILSYQEGKSSRLEEGQPGRKVTGQWSWIDPSGKSHVIRYIADEFGFRTFGDDLPTTTPKSSHQSFSQRKNLRATTITQQNLPDHFILGQMIKNNIKHSVNGIVKHNVKSDTNTASVLSLNSVLVEAQVDANNQRKIPSSVDKSKPRQLPKLDTDNSGRPQRSNQVPFSQKPIQKPTESTNTATRKLAKMISGDIAGNIQDLFNSEFPNPIAGTRFILVDSLQPPTIPKNRNQPTKITPVKVDVSEPITIVVSGLHSSSRSKSLSTHHSNPLLRKSIENRTQHVPRPSKVEGNLNLENFFSPFVRTTPQPFQLDSLNDYYYYDYDYYDYLDGESNSSSINSSTTSTAPTNATSQFSNKSLSENMQDMPSDILDQIPQSSLKSSLPGNQESSDVTLENPMKAVPRAKASITAQSTLQNKPPILHSKNIQPKLSVGKSSLLPKIPSVTSALASPNFKSVASSSNDADSKESTEHGNSEEDNASDADQSDENFEEESDD